MSPLPAGPPRAVFVSGAASGIGREAALAFARQGDAVIVCDLAADAVNELVEQIASGGGIARAVLADVTDAERLVREVERAERGFPPLRAAFNAAGVEGPLARVEEISTADWERTLAVNLTGVWNCMRLQLPRLALAGGGSIVNCASVFGQVGSRGGSAYAASKHAVVGLTRIAALENAGRGIRINAVCPGLTDTAMLDRLDEANPRFRAAALALSPAGRLVLPGGVAAMVTWLCSAEAEYVNGQAIAIDDGMTVG